MLYRREPGTETCFELLRPIGSKINHLCVTGKMDKRYAAFLLYRNSSENLIGYYPDREAAANAVAAEMRRHEAIQKNPR